MASTSQPPRRRFLPQPVETTTRSSKRQHVETPDKTSSLSENNRTTGDLMVAATKPRRFLPQPVEETTRSSRRKNEEMDTPDSRNKASTSVSGVPPTHSDDSTLPGYPTSKPSTSSRRFTPEPVETTTRSSRRKFAVEPVETTTRSSKQEKETDTDPSSRPRRKFVPEPVETTTVRRRRNDLDEDSNESPPGSPSEASSRVSSRQSTGSRRFSPELIETAKASYRHKKDPDSPRSTQHLKLTHSPPLSPSRSSSRSSEPADECESRFSAAALAKRNHEERRQHSYCIPNLPDIESESSSDESTPSLTESPSSTDNELHKLGKIKEEHTQSYTEYVLALTESNERKQLQQQAMAAYINERPHEPVSHFAADAEDDEDLVHIGHLSADDGADPKTFRRSSQDEHDWEMENMRRHHEQLEQAKKELQEDTAGVSRFSAAALASRHHLGQTHKQTAKAKKQKDEDTEFARMRKAASPPMAGDDLVFPFTVSPKMTRCDVDQAPRPRRADSDDDKSSVESIGQQMWCSQVNDESSSGAGLWMGSCQRLDAPAGLWMGSCQRGPDASRPATPTKSGIQTPAFESPNPFESLTPGRGTRTPGRRLPRPYSGLQFLPTPPRSHEGSRDDFTDTVDKKLRLEKQIEEEFPPRVITQIYNYLSLGFPSLARDFDEELSKISRIPVKELRRHDSVMQGVIKGHVGTPETEGTWEEDEDGTVRGCRRWDALKLYVKEWARQSPNFTTSFPVAPDPALAHIKTSKVDAWGATVRKGSWAL